MSQSGEQPDNTAPVDDYVVPAVEDLGGFDDVVEIPLDIEVAPEPTPEASANDEPADKDIPNNLHVNKNVILRINPYKAIKRERGGAILIVPKRAAKIDELSNSWTVDEADITANLTDFLIEYSTGMTAQPTASYTKNSDGETIGFYDSTLDDPQSKWEQGITAPNGDVVYGRRPGARASTEKRNLVGSAARDRNMMCLGLGLGSRKPLPGTGVHVDLSARSSMDYITLDTLLEQDKIQTGRDSLGLIYKNSDVSQVRIVWDFIKKSIKRANIQNYSPDNLDIDLGDYIRCTDLPVLYWAQVSTMFPNGYPLDLPCSSGVNICTHVERVLFDVDSALWVNTAKLSATQIERLHNSSHLMSENDLALYQDNAKSPFTKTIDVNENIKLVLKVPTINEYIEHGTAWMAELSATADELFASTEQNEVAITNHINEKLNKSVIREYSHWVREIIYMGNDVVSDPADVANNLGEMSSHSDELTVDVMAEIQRFIESTSIAIIGIPNFACPVCEKDHVTEEFTNHPDLIPIDMLRHFFQVKDLRTTIPTTKSSRY